MRPLCFVEASKPGTLAVDNNGPVFLVIASGITGRSSTSSAAMGRGQEGAFWRNEAKKLNDFRINLLEVLDNHQALRRPMKSAALPVN
jgi:hypothetical protein